jgi:hypothetical protein
MSLIWFRPLMLAAVASLLADPQPKSQPKSGATASGVFVGRSGKPMAKARLIVGEVVSDEELLYAKIKLPSNLPAALTDDKGQFQLTGFPPGRYTIVYQLAGATTIPPAEINIKALSAVTRSILPFMVKTEIGTSGEPFAQRVWGRTFTLLKGHTFYSEGANMRIWNATARLSQQGPYLEIRKGVIWLVQLNDKSQFKLEAWSY